MKIRKIILAIILLNFCRNSKTCKNNCYLGGNFFSMPMDSKRCCRSDLMINNCEYYSPILNSVVCFRCELGYQWNNNECVKFGEVPNDNNGIIFYFK